MAKLQEMGEFVRSASSTVEHVVARKLRERFAAQAWQASFVRLAVPAERLIAAR